MAGINAAGAINLPTNHHSQAVAERTAPILEHGLQRKGMEYGSPIFIRIFKLEKSLEVWIEGNNGRYELYNTYRICAYSGGLGPKIRQGDRQSPEGFYSVKPQALNPNSQFHLSFDIGFPNAYDRAYGRTGDYLMVHGSCISRGCYAMTDRRMDEIYTLAFAALEGGQYEIPVHIFPFKMTKANMRSSEKSKWFSFWQNLKTGHDIFEETKVPPMVWAENGEYGFYKKGPRRSRLLAFGRAPRPHARPAFMPALKVGNRPNAQPSRIKRDRLPPRRSRRTGPLDADAVESAVEALKTAPIKSDGAEKEGQEQD